MSHAFPVSVSLKSLAPSPRLFACNNSAVLADEMLAAKQGKRSREIDSSRRVRQAPIAIGRFSLREGKKRGKGDSLQTPSKTAKKHYCSSLLRQQYNIIL
eukprot:TRINITY_DN1684_c0_g1_i1.p2 TRINITY_DN1684_c0_g1~~TRINITY_DN1684_c0_g1_i1.p2  ORF type:complete len:100 (+),score=19.95 TRINITY_DN1684_c0_g1_i1:457-756(+)